jgi:hypothetical protein
MMYTQRHWTTLSYRRALRSLVISLAVTWVIALGCIEGVARRDGVFLRTSKSGGRHTTVAALRLARVETLLAAALYVSAGLLAGLRHRPWLLIFLVAVQATVYLCAPIAAVWNLRAQAVPDQQRRRGVAERRLRAQRRRTRVLLPKPAAAALTALCVGGVTSAFVFPVALLHATTPAPAAVSPQSLLAAAGTEVYLKLGSTVTGDDSVYYPVTSVHLSDLTLSFDTSSLVLLGEVLGAAADGGHISRVTLAFRTPGHDGRAATKLVDTFATAAVTSLQEHLTGTPAGTVSLLLPTASDVTGTAGALQRTGPFSGPPAAGPATAYVNTAYMNTGNGAPSYAVTAVSLSQTASGAPLDLSFTTSAPPLLDGIFQAEGAAAVIPVLTLTVRSGTRGRLLRHAFSGLSVSSFAENLSGSVAGTATLVVRAR